MITQNPWNKIAAVAVGVAITASALAQTVTVNQLTGYFAGTGEFNVMPVVGSGYGADALVGGGYETFCIGRDANIGVPGQYFYSVDANGVYQPFSLTISKGSAWLYSQFAGGTLFGYHYVGAGIIDPGQTYSERANDAYSLQRAFWTLEGQYWYGANGPGPASAQDDLNGNPWLNLVANAFGGGTNGLIAAMSANTPGGYNVGVLNLNLINADGSKGAAAQPMLVLLPSTPCTGSICGKIFADCDGSGDLTDGDVGLKSVGVKLLDASSNVIASASTDTNGAYCFGNLGAGTFTVSVTPPAGYKQTAASSGYHWKDGYGRTCWKENDDNYHCISSGIECWLDKTNCLHWKDSWGRDCWKDNWGSFHCQWPTYKSCNAQTNNNTLTITLTNCQSALNADFAYKGTAPSLGVCVTAPSWTRCGQTVNFTCTITNSGNVCFKGGTVCNTIGNCGWWGWNGTSCFTNTCPPLSPGDSCTVTQKCTLNWWNVGTVGCQSKVNCSGTSGQSYCSTQVSW